MPVLLENIVEALELASDQMEAYLDIESGEVVLVSQDDEIHLEGGDIAVLAEWEREHLAKVRQVLDRTPVLRLPNSFDIHQWSIMEKFCYTLDDGNAREKLLRAIKGKGAFQRFRQTVDELGVREQWSVFLKTNLEDKAREWLLANNIAFRE